MALNEVYANADSLNYVVNPSVVSGDFVVIGDLVGVAETSAKLGADGSHYATLRHVGVFTGITEDIIDPGMPVYIAGGVLFGNELTGSDGSGTNVQVGLAYKTNGGSVAVRINN